MREQEGVFCTGQCLCGDLQEELTTPKNGKPKMKHGGLTLTITALGFVICISTGATDGVQAGHSSLGYAAAHHAKTHTGRKIVCFVRRNRARLAHKVCRPVGGYWRLKVRDVLWGPAGMPQAPTDFGPHFDFPAHSLNNGP